MNNSELSGARWIAAVAAVTAAALLTLTPPAVNAAQPATKGNNGNGNGNAPGTAVYSGQAVALRIDGVTKPTPGQILLCDTGPLPAAGGSLHVSQSNFNYANGALTIAQADARTTGSGPQTLSQSTITGYHAEFIEDDGPDGLFHRALIEADFIYGEAAATADKKGDVSFSSKVIIQNLRVDGHQVIVTGQANQRVELPPGMGGWLLINEVVRSNGEIIVYPIRFHVCHCIDGQIGMVRAGLQVSGTPPPPEAGDCGKLTGGGWILSNSGAKCSFGVSGGIRRGEFWGHLEYIDHGTGMQVKSTGVTNFQTNPSVPDARIITYNVTINGAAGTAVVDAWDRGEPGRDDFFAIRLSTGYNAKGTLGGDRPGGGNLQLHKCPPGWE
jgi:hypothetical protein